MLKTIVLSGLDIQGLDLIKRAVLECEQLEEEGVAERYELIGNVLYENVDRIGLDEDINQLLGFARCVGCEILSPSVKQQHYPSGCWSENAFRKVGPRFYIKENGVNHESSVVRPIEKQKIGLAMIVVGQMRNDPVFSLGAEKLINYKNRNNLWTIEDGDFLNA